MYESFYKLHAKPFRLSPDPNYFYPSSGHKRALSYLLYGLNQGEGFVVITGAPGTGKTTLAQKLLSQIDSSGILVAHLSSTQVEAEDLLRLVATSFKLRSENVSKAALLKDIESFLIARARERKRCLLVVDEAQNLPERSIEELRMLSNFQANHHALLQIFLLGQEQFRSMLESPELEQLHQRVIANFHLNPLDVVETQRYVESRLRQSGWANDPHIADDAYGIIFSYTGGLPRRINMFCDRLFLYGYMEGLHVFTRETVASVIEELKVDVSSRGRNVVFTPVDRDAAAPAPPVTSEPDTEPETPERAKSPLSESVSPAPMVAPRETSDSVTVITPVAAPASPPAPVPESVKTGLEPNKTESFAASLFARISEMETKTSPRAAETSGYAEQQTAPEFEGLPKYLHADRSPAEAGPLAAAAPPPETSADRPQYRARWSAALAAVALVLIIGVWFFPYFQNSETVPDIDRMPAPSQATRATGNDTADSKQRSIVEDPTEKILSEASFAPASGSSDAQTRVEPIETESRQTSVPPEISPPPRTPEPKPATPERESPKNNRTERADAPPARTPKRSSPTPVVASRPAPTREAPTPIKAAERTPPPTSPAQVPAATADSGIAATVAPATDAETVRSPEVTAPAPSEVTATAALNPAPAPIAEPLSQLELAQVLLKFTRYYEEGNLELFARLFSSDIQTEERSGISALREDYRDLFQKTASRQIILGDIRWERSGASALGGGPFELRIRPRADEPARVFKGTIRFQIEKRNGALLITSLRHTAK